MRCDYFLPLLRRMCDAKALNSSCEQESPMKGCCTEEQASLGTGRKMYHSTCARLTINSCSEVARFAGSLCNAHLRKCLNLELHLAGFLSSGEAYMTTRHVTLIRRENGTKRGNG
jgi:hypothetical protein